MASIGSINDLTNLGSGVYQMNFFGTPNRGFVTSDNNVLASLWYCKVKMKFGTDWNWGYTEYGGAGQYLANNKIFRLWNPGDTKENAYTEFTAREGNGTFKFACEDANGGNRFNEYFGGDNWKDKFKAGTTHIFEFEFKENSYFKCWIDGVQVADITDFISKATSFEKRIYCLGLENEWNSGTKYGNNTLTLSEIVMAENKTRDQYNGGTVSTPVPPTSPTTPVPPSTPIYALKSDLDALNAKVEALKAYLRGV